MMRRAVLVLAVLAGLLAAALAEGRAGHLRALGVPVPAGVADDAGLWRGAAEGPGGLRLHWRARWPGLAGPVWALRAEAPAGRAEGVAQLSWTGGRLWLTGVQGRASLADLRALAERVRGPIPDLPPDLAGEVTLTAAAAHLALRPPAPVAAEAAGALRGLVFAGAALGDGPLAARLADGAWTADLRLPGLHLAGQGMLEARKAEMVLDLADPAILPPDLRAAIEPALLRTETGWRLSAVLPLP